MKKKDKEKFLTEARSRFKSIQQEQADNRRNALNNLRFVYNVDGGQWPQSIRAEREADQRPCLTSNKLRKFVALEANMERDQRLAGEVRPVDDKADPITAKIIAGMIRQIEYVSEAETAYTLAGEKAIAGGFPGYVRIVTEETPDSFDQEIFIKKVDNQFSVYMDRRGEYCFIREGMKREVFKKKWPKADAISFDYGSEGEEYSLWWEDDKVFISEYFYLEEYDKTIAEVLNIQTGETEIIELKDEVTPEILMEQGLNILRQKTSKANKIKWAKITAVDILEEKDWAGSSIPIIEFTGDEVNIAGKTYQRALFEDGKDPQMAYNYWLTHMTESIALVPKAPYIATAEQIAEYLDIWKSANKVNHSVLPYKYIPNMPRPKREIPATIPTGAAQMLQISAADIQDSIGKYESSFGERSNERTGVALRQRAGRSDFGTYHFRDNFRRAVLNGVVKQLIDLIPKIYDTERIVRILGDNNKETTVTINKSFVNPADGKTIILNDLSKGKYDVVADTKVWSTRRQESSDAMTSMAQAMPNLAPLFADLIFEFNDWPGADIIKDRLKKNLPALLGQKEAGASAEASAGTAPGGTPGEGE